MTKKKEQVPYFEYITLQKIISRLIGIFIVALITVVLISYLLNPEGFIQFPKNWIYVPAIAISSLFSVFGTISSVLIEIYKENKLFCQDENTLYDETINAKRGLQPNLLGLENILQREETNIVLKKLGTQKAILLTGEAGFGKSCICVSLFNQINNYYILFDVRRLGGVTTKNQLTNHLGIKKDIKEVIKRLSHKQKCIIIFDQLDSVCQSPIGKFIVEFAIECKRIDGVTVIVISRHREINEKKLLRELYEADFEEVAIKPLDDSRVENILIEHGLVSPSTNIIELGKNILMLDLMCSILRNQGSQPFENINDDISIWENYIDLFLNKEEANLKIEKKVILDSLIQLAKAGLSKDDRGFMLDDPPNLLQNRFCSEGLISKINTNGRRSLFKLEKLQDYLYARDASNRELSREEVEKEIHNFYLKSVILWIIDFYKRDSSHMYEVFLEEGLHG